MSSNRAESSPVPATITSNTSSGHDEIDKYNFLNLKCDASNENKLSKVSLSDIQLRGRLVAVLVSCNQALHQTKHLTDNYVS